MAAHRRVADGRRRRTDGQHPAGRRSATDEAVEFTASGRTITFPGFLRAYVESRDEGAAGDDDQGSDDAERRLPRVERGQQLDTRELDAKGHTTTPPSRYTEPSLVARLEELGIGRPSTYASIMQTIQDRGYVWKKGAALVPSFVAFAVVNLLEQHFAAAGRLRLHRLAGGRARRDRRREPAAGSTGSPSSTSAVRAGSRAASPRPAASSRSIGQRLEEIDARGVNSIPLRATAAPTARRSWSGSVATGPICRPSTCNRAKQTT